MYSSDREHLAEGFCNSIQWRSIAALDLEKIEDLAAKGLTLEQIAAALNIDVRTLYNHRKKFREVGEAINRGAANGIATIANKLFEAANNGNVTAQIFRARRRR